jgi:hypothetical protein
MVAGVFVLGCLARLARIDESRLLARDTDETSWPDEPLPTASWDRVVSPTVVGAVMIAGLVAISVVMCYGYYPPPRDVLEEIAVARAECLSAANAGQVEHAAHWLEIWDDWSRRLEVGTFLRTGELRPYQRVQGHLIRKKLELLEHELEHDPFELDVTRQVVREILATNRRWVQAFRPAAG